MLKFMDDQTNPTYVTGNTAILHGHPFCAQQDIRLNITLIYSLKNKTLNNISE